jgi:hypothetical protein
MSGPSPGVAATDGLTPRLRVGSNGGTAMRQSLLSSSFSITVALLACACGGAVGEGGAAPGKLPAQASQFPSQDALAKIAAAPVPAHLFDDKAKDVPTWELSEPLPDAMELAPHHDDSTWSKLLEAAAAARGDAVTTTEAMHCVAREQAAFVLANDAMPAEPLVAFIAARCGSPMVRVGVVYQTIAGDDRIPEAKIEAQFSAPAKAMIEKTIKTGRLDAGIAYLRKNGHAVIALAVAPRSVRVERTPMIPAGGGEVVVRGEVLDPVGSVRAMINRGRYGFGACTLDPSIALPRFAFTCSALPADEAAWLTMSVIAPGRILGTAALEMLVWPAGTPKKTYAKLTRDEAAAAPTAGVQAADLVVEINRVRKEASLAPLRLAEQESRTVTRLAPHYFAALHEGGETQVADQVALGVRAGWEVEGLVRHGNVISNWTQGAGDSSAIVRLALAHPFGRETLLDPEAERVAIGTVGDEKTPDTGALFATYALFDSYHHDNDGAVVTQRLTTLRAAHRALPPTLVTELNEEAQFAAKSVQDGKRTPEEALDELLKRASARSGGRALSGGISESTNLESMKFPDTMLTTPSLLCGVGVGHYRQQGHPWGRFLIFYVMVGSSSGPTARQGEPHSG